MDDNLKDKTSDCIEFNDVQQENSEKIMGKGDTNFSQNINKVDSKIGIPRKKILSILVLFVLISILLYLNSNHYKYNLAKNQYESQEYDEALNNLKEIENYKDSKKLYKKVEHKKAVSNDNTPPVITSNSETIEIEQYENFDITQWVSNNVIIEDDVSEELTCTIDYSQLDINQSGEYDVILSTEDEAKNKASKTIKVIVKHIYTQDEIENIVKSTYKGKEIPGLEKIEFEDNTVWVYISQDGMAQAAIAAKISADVKESWNSLREEFNKISLTIYGNFLSHKNSDVEAVNVVLLNDLDKTKLLYVSVNGAKFFDVTD